MSRNKALAQLQKTYDDSYLSCSTAVYYESQGNEDDAMRCWRNALDRISHHQTSRALSSYVPRSETENALVESLRELELQCKERIDLLEALRVSRQENGGAESPGESSEGLERLEGSPSRGRSKEKGWIGQGTIPAITYPELSRPSLPRRPSLPNRMSSEMAVVGSKAAVDMDQLQIVQPPSMAVNMEKTLRSPSPEKHMMRTTLRNTKSSDKTKARRQPARTPEGPGASKAATIAWSALSAKDRLLGGLAADTASPAPIPNFEPPVDQQRASSSSSHLQWDSHSRRLLGTREAESSVASEPTRERRSQEGAYPQPSLLSISAASSALNAVSAPDLGMMENSAGRLERPSWQGATPQLTHPSRTTKQTNFNTLGTSVAAAERPESTPQEPDRRKSVDGQLRAPSLITADSVPRGDPAKAPRRAIASPNSPPASCSIDDIPGQEQVPSGKKRGRKQKEPIMTASLPGTSSEESPERQSLESLDTWQQQRKAVLKNLPTGVDEGAAKQIFNEIVIRGDEVHWSDVAGLDIAKNALRETVVYPFLRPDLFMGLREPARGMLLFGPPGTGKTMLARAVATESKSTFFSISASSLTSKYLGDSEKLVRALFGLAKAMAPSIIFVDEIDSLLSHRSGSSEHEATRRIKTEFLIQWSNLQRAAAGRESNDKERGDATRVLVLAATNLPWAIDEAARRRFVRRQYIPLPEPQTRATQLRTLLGEQKHTLSEADIEQLVELTDGFSGSDITALAKDAAMGPLRSVGDALLHMTMDDIRPIELADFRASLTTIRPSVSKAGLKEYEDWAREFGERGG